MLLWLLFALALYEHIGAAACPVSPAAMGSVWLQGPTASLRLVPLGSCRLVQRRGLHYLSSLSCGVFRHFKISLMCCSGVLRGLACQLTLLLSYLLARPSWARGLSEAWPQDPALAAARGRGSCLCTAFSQPLLLLLEGPALCCLLSASRALPAPLADL